MCTTDYDYADVYNEKVYKAKKTHKCSECFRSIESGEQYTKVDGLWEGRWSTYKTCQHCLVLQNWLVKECGGFLHGGLQEEIIDHADEYRTLWLYRAQIGLKRGWKQFKSDRLMPILKMK